MGNFWDLHAGDTACLETGIITWMHALAHTHMHRTRSMRSANYGSWDVALCRVRVMGFATCDMITCVCKDFRTSLRGALGIMHAFCTFSSCMCPFHRYSPVSLFPLCLPNALQEPLQLLVGWTGVISHLQLRSTQGHVSKAIHLQARTHTHTHTFTYVYSLSK